MCQRMRLLCLYFVGFLTEILKIKSNASVCAGLCVVHLLACIEKEKNLWLNKCIDWFHWAANAAKHVVKITNCICLMFKRVAWHIYNSA